MNPVTLTPIFARIFDAIDRRDLANAYVISGCIASAHGVGSRQVDVTSGIIVTGAGVPASPGAQNVTPGALANPLASRCDLIYYPSGSTVLTLAAGAEVVVAPGQPAVPPALPAGACAIALAYIVPGAIDYSGATSAFVENIQQNGVNSPYFGPTGPWANVGDIRMRNNASIAARDAANTADKSLAYLDTLGNYQWGDSAGVHVFQSGAITIGANPAQSGNVRMTTAGDVVDRNNANTNDISMIRSNASDQVVINAGAAAATLVASGQTRLATNPSTVGVLGIPTGNNNRISFRNAANTGEGMSIENDGTDTLTARQNGTLATVTGVGFIAYGANSAGSGAVRLPNATYMFNRNAANTGDLGAVGIAGDNILRLYDSRIAAQQTALTALADGTGHVVAGAAYWRN